MALDPLQASLKIGPSVDLSPVSPDLTDSLLQILSIQFLKWLLFGSGSFGPSVQPKVCRHILSHWSFEIALFVCPFVFTKLILPISVSEIFKGSLLSWEEKSKALLGLKLTPPVKLMRAM